MRILMVPLLAVFLAVPGALAQEKSASKKDVKRQEIDEMAQETLDILFLDSTRAEELYNDSEGYAVFNNIKISLGISGGGGVGVAVDKKAGTRTYMKMGTAGLNIGLGGQRYQMVFLFQNKDVLDNFIEQGWQADAQANAVLWDKGKNAEATFRNGLAVYQLTGKGLMLQADIAGTKYWKNKKLNR